VNIHLITVGTKMPAWVTTAYSEYAKRLPRECSLTLKEINAAQRTKNSNADKYKMEEARRLEAAIPWGARIIVLDERGQQWTTRQLSSNLEQWMQGGQDIALLVGGPDGLDKSLLQKARQKWSLSPLTLPHPMVRVVLAEQLYRAWSILQGHPYHRE
jgi:23S rRNA (pseudouridine1915-N3)-methyltransferase